MTVEEKEPLMICGTDQATMLLRWADMRDTSREDEPTGKIRVGELRLRKEKSLSSTALTREPLR